MTKHLFVITIISAILFGGYIHAQAADQDPHTIEVSGAADVLVVPDEIVIRLAVHTLNISLAQSKKENDDRVKKILLTARQAQIDEKDVQTDHVRIFMNSNVNREGGDVFKGYDCLTSIAVILRDVKRYDEVISKLLQAGANSLGEVEFRTTELRKHRDEARRCALIAAREKATAMAETLDQAIGKPLSIVEQSPERPQWNQFANMQVQYDEPPRDTDLNETSTIALGRIRVSASVKVRFELREKE